MLYRRGARSLSIGLLVCLFLTMSSPATQPVGAQAGETGRAIDMMIVIDNSCSMFPANRIVPGCEVWGNDPDFLRITGADLFIARLGFAEANENEYQAGVVSLGETPRLISPLQPLSNARDALAQAISNPTPELATGIIPALKLAYQELRESPNRRPANLPAIILITDGIPYPRAGQTDAEIEKLISENPDIPLFTMLLQNPATPSPEFEQYIQAWQQMQARHAHVLSYRIQNAKQIEETYNTIIAQMQNTVPSTGVSVAPGTPLEVFVSKCVQKMVVTIIHQAGQPKGTITIKDPVGAAIQDNDPGVSHFRGPVNPVEVISISAPRLQDALKEAFWGITSDEAVLVFLDRQGCYRINFLTPSVSLTNITNVYLATERHSPNREFTIRFNLLDMTGSAVTPPQPIEGKVFYPNGQEAPLLIPTSLQPDASGVYKIQFDFAGQYPAVLDQAGRFTFVLNAGSADDQATERIPIATARLLVNVGRGPYFDSITPEPLVCAPNQPADITVNVGDYDTALPGTVRLRLFGPDGSEVMLTPGTSGVYSGTLANLCTSLLASLACSAQQEETLRLRMTAQLTDGTLLPSTEREVALQVIAPACTPTPTPTATATPEPTATPTPTPTPIPDSDGDGVDDLHDECVNRAQWMPFPQFNGCPPPWWLLLLAGLVIVALLAFIILWLVPWATVRISPPPKAYVLVCRTGEKRATPRSVYSTGMARRARQVTIGGDRRKAHIYVQGLKPVEFVVVQQGDRVVLLNAEKETVERTFSDRSQDSVTTSSSEVTLRISLDQSKLRC